MLSVQHGSVAAVCTVLCIGEENICGKDRKTQYESNCKVKTNYKKPQLCLRFSDVTELHVDQIQNIHFVC